MSEIDFGMVIERLRLVTDPQTCKVYVDWVSQEHQRAQNPEDRLLVMLRQARALRRAGHTLYAACVYEDALVLAERMHKQERVVEIENEKSTLH